MPKTDQFLDLYQFSYSRKVRIKPWPNGSNMLMQHHPTLLNPTYCTRLATMLHDVGWCWTKFDFHQTLSSTSSNMLHSFGHHVARCCMMLDDVERSLISIKHCLQHHPTFRLFLSVNKNVALVWPPCSTLLNACMPAKHLFPWQWFTVYACFVRSAWMLRYGMVNEESFQSLRRNNKRSLRKLKKKGQSSRWKPENCEIAALEMLLEIDKFLLSRGIVDLLLIFRLQLYC